MNGYNKNEEKKKGEIEFVLCILWVIGYESLAGPIGLFRID